jgi:GxxExxY protein
MEMNDLTGLVIEHSIDIHRKLGPGLFESMYEEVLHYKLTQSGLQVHRQQEVPVIFEGKKMGIGFRADLIVEDALIVEIKSIEKLQPVHAKQLLTYMKLTQIPIGLLINFNESLLVEGIKRLRI